MTDNGGEATQSTTEDFNMNSDFDSGSLRQRVSGH